MNSSNNRVLSADPFLILCLFVIMLDGVDGIVATAVPYGVILLGSVVYLLVYRFWWSQKRQHNIFEGDCCPPVRGTGNTIAVRSLATPSFINIHVHYSAHKLGNNVPLIVFLHGLGTYGDYHISYHQHVVFYQAES